MFEQVSARFVLWLMSFLSYMLQCILLTNINIAITDMVEEPHNGNNLNQLNDSMPLSNIKKFSWNEAEKGVILGAPYWILPVSHIISGAISHKIGPKIVIGFSILMSSALNFAIPTFAANFTLLVITRALLGLFNGLSFPSVLTIVQYWIPENERGKFVSCIIGFNFGSAVVNFFGGILIDFMTWTSVFYLPATLGVLWCAAWTHLMYDRPEHHPRITEKEKEYIFMSTKHARLNSGKAQKSIPWLKIITSVEVLTNAFGQLGCVWTWLAVATYGPTFLKTVHNMRISMVGFAVGIPFLLRVGVSLIYSVLTDYLISEKIMSMTNVRKLSIVIAHIIPFIALVIQVVYDGNLYITLAAMTCIIVCTGTNIHGYIAGLIDISPSFGGAIQGICSAVSMASGFLVPILVGYLTLNNNTIEQWRKFFIITAGLCLSSGLFFILTWNSRIKSWDNDHACRNNQQGLQALKSDFELNDSENF